MDLLKHQFLPLTGNTTNLALMLFPPNPFGLSFFSFFLFFFLSFSLRIYLFKHEAAKAVERWKPGVEKVVAQLPFHQSPLRVVWNVSQFHVGGRVLVAF
jgi:hypothetical protein